MRVCVLLWNELKIYKDIADRIQIWKPHSFQLALQYVKTKSKTILQARN